MKETRIALLMSEIETAPNEPFNYYALAMEYLENEPDKAITLLEKLYHEHPNYVPLYYQLVSAMQLLKRPQKKIDEVYKKGIEVAEKQENIKATKELKSSYLNWQFEE